MTKGLKAAVCAVGVVGAAAFAQATSQQLPNPTPEQRNKMADVHQKFATCLRSDRPLADCHDEMVKACHDTTGTLCHMMGGLGMGGQGKMMKPSPTK